ncbi:Small GTP-binding protein [Halorhabdus tiamatea SARL4B]|uniref:Ferrous iron transport protein B n=1 Tax=Halorhabdus tiamatea SARL4B TaxID=1033806 RepID=F7PHH6_9EURY|nr:ferrous iron transport protein B [Halorhabdus tiamatea]ERJ06783.1 Small GTP-binding protein [Halorhabdus tiamatea SARL4B]CCQ33706.1 small GTP-binding protein [Halorhabdus tiamatea SARL4B]
MEGCHDAGCDASEIDADSTLALVGCPNVGKSVVFGELAEQYVDVSNYPGTTVDTTLAEFGEYKLTDTPGVYGISAFNEEERVTREIVLEADAVVNVVDATHLDRDLFLTLQLLDMGVPTVVALNMMDEAEADGIDIDVDALEDALGVPVVPTVAIDGEGFEDLRERIPAATAPESTAVEDYYDELPDELDATRAEKTLLVEGDEPLARAVDVGGVMADGGSPALVEPGLREEIYGERRSRVQSVVDSVQEITRTDDSIAERVSDLMINPLTGTPIALATLGLIYYFIGDLVAQRLVDKLEVAVLGAHYIPAVESFVAGVLPDATWVEPIEFLLLNDNLGLLTVTVQYLVGALLPLVVAFYLAISLLEDSGVLPRLAVLTDRGLNRVGLNGRAIVPMIVGVGCVTMAIITTRMVGSKRERTISTALLGLAVPCSAQLGVIMGLIASLGMIWWFGYLGVLLVVLGVAGVFLDRTLPGQSEPLVAELPRMRAPRPGNILRKTYNRAKMFLREAIPLFAGTALAISALDYVGGLDAIKAGLRPLTSLVGMPADFGQVLVLGLIRRDFAAAGMTDMALSSAQVFVGLVVVTLFVPCILSMVMILKERDAKSALLMWVGSWVVAFGVGGILAATFGVVGL